MKTQNWLMVLCIPVLAGCASMNAGRPPPSAESITPDDLLSEDLWKSITPETFQELVAKKTDFKTYDDEGWTPLMHAAASCSDTGVMTGLIAYSADLFYEAEDGNSLLTLIENNEALKNTDLYRTIQGWHENEMHYQMALKAEAEKKRLEAEEEEKRLEEERDAAPEEAPEPELLPDDEIEED